jgi:5-methyltetrahydrofolate--homocysteine methyltransferase
MEQIQLERINRKEIFRYLGYGDTEPDERFLRLIDECEKQVLSIVEPRATYKVAEIKECLEGVMLVGTNLVLPGNSIRQHLQGCTMGVMMAATLSEGIDRLLRTSQIYDMTSAMIIDTIASAAVEQLCDKVENIISKQYPDKYMTFRFGLGYGDLPIEYQRDFLNVLEAQKRIGLHTNDSHMLIPTKSVTAVIGLSDQRINAQARGCQTCNLKGNCQFRKKGGHCNE